MQLNRHHHVRNAASAPDLGTELSTDLSTDLSTERTSC